jgi:hypothetical protein
MNILNYIINFFKSDNNKIITNDNNTNKNENINESDDNVNKSVTEDNYIDEKYYIDRSITISDDILTKKKIKYKAIEKKIQDFEILTDEELKYINNNLSRVRLLTIIEIYHIHCVNINKKLEEF